MSEVVIDKVAFIAVRDQKLLMALSAGKDTWYLPGGKREAGESDQQALTREVFEELQVTLDPASITYYGTFTAPAHGQPAGTLVRAICYTGRFSGSPTPGSEIAELAYLPYRRKGETGAVAHLLFDDLHQRGLIA